MSAEIGHFLRTRRARIKPSDVGLPEHGRRRVPGLRREELAQLAGVSIDYYNRLEQGRAPAVSDAVLDAIARVLRLDETELRHLSNLARPPTRRPHPRLNDLRPSLRQMIEAMPSTPAAVLGRRTDVLGWNALGDALYGFSAMAPSERNAAWHTFLHPGIKDFYPDWETVAEETVAVLRMMAGADPHDEALADLVSGIASRSAEFRAMWERHPVLERAHGFKRMRHPVVGELELTFETMGSPAAADEMLVVYSAAPGSASEERLGLLASWAASEVSS